MRDLHLTTLRVERAAWQRWRQAARELAARRGCDVPVAELIREAVERLLEAEGLARPEHRTDS